MKLLSFALLLFCFLSSCDHIASINEEPVPTFTEIRGIKYAEVHRRFGNGLSFSDEGFQLEPEWDVYFNADDSIRIFSPEKQQYMTYRIFHSHKALFQFAREWFRVQHVSRDSIKLQVMELEAREVKEEKSDIYMTLYSHDYIKNKLHTTIEEMRKPTAEDSLFMKYRALQANSHPDSAFAARNPVAFTPRSPMIQVEKVAAALDPYLGYVNRSENYLYPEYKIRINKAYRDFTYSFRATVDYRGRITFKDFLVPIMPEFRDAKTKAAKGVIDVYLKNLLKVAPGNTLGFPHASVISLHVMGRRGGS